jgi:hypothetical protein
VTWEWWPVDTAVYFTYVGIDIPSTVYVDTDLPEPVYLRTLIRNAMAFPEVRFTVRVPFAIVVNAKCSHYAWPAPLTHAVLIHTLASYVPCRAALPSILHRVRRHHQRMLGQLPSHSTARQRNSPWSQMLLPTATHVTSFALGAGSVTLSVCAAV